VEFEKQSKGLCLSPIGMATGLEPRVVFVEWRPASDDVQDDPARKGVRGTYLLQGDPSGVFCFAEVVENAKEQMDASSAEILSVFVTAEDEDISSWWKEFFRIYTPPADGSNFVDHLTRNMKKPHIPLQNLLQYADVKVIDPVWKDRPPVVYRSAAEYIDWPDALLAATNSVRTSLNSNPPEPRLFLPSDTFLIDQRILYTELAEPEYAHMRTMTLRHLCAKVKRKMGYNGLYMISLGCKYLFYYRCISIIMCVYFYFSSDKRTNRR
jgi:hypothetical protein